MTLGSSISDTNVKIVQMSSFMFFTSPEGPTAGNQCGGFLQTKPVAKIKHIVIITVTDTRSTHCQMHTEAELGLLETLGASQS